MNLTETNLYKATKTWVDYMHGDYDPTIHEAHDSFKNEEKMLADMKAALEEAENQPQPEAESIPWCRDDDNTLNTTLLISEEHFVGTITLERIAKWSDEECEAVENYCLAVHINASDNDDFPVPQKPSVLIAEVA